MLHIIHLEDTAFFFRGAAVPGEHLARLLGLAGGGEAKQPRSQRQADIEATLAQIREQLEQAASWSLSVEVEKTYGAGVDQWQTCRHGVTAGKVAIRLDVERDKNRAKPSHSEQPADAPVTAGP